MVYGLFRVVISQIPPPRHLKQSTTIRSLIIALSGIIVLGGKNVYFNIGVCWNNSIGWKNGNLINGIRW